MISKCYIVRSFPLENLPGFLRNPGCAEVCLGRRIAQRNLDLRRAYKLTSRTFLSFFGKTKHAVNGTVAPYDGK